MRKPRLFIYLAFLVIAFLGGAISQYYFPGRSFSPVKLGATVISAVLLFAWYRADADAHAYIPSPPLNVAVIFLALLALPYYFFRSRKALPALGATLGFLGTVILGGCLELTGAFAAYYGLQA